MVDPIKWRICRLIAYLAMGAGSGRPPPARKKVCIALRLFPLGSRGGTPRPEGPKHFRRLRESVYHPAHEMFFSLAHKKHRDRKIRPRRIAPDARGRVRMTSRTSNNCSAQTVDCVAMRIDSVRL